MSTTSEVPDTARREDPAWLRTAPAILLAALGLLGAIVAWRVGVAGNRAGDLNDTGLAAARAKSAAVVAGEGVVAQTQDAWLEYERDRRRAQALLDAGYAGDADSYWKQAAANWVLVRSDYISRDGVYQPDRQRAGLLAEAASENNLDYAPAFTEADSLWDSIGGLTVGGFVAAIGLPFLAVAEGSDGKRQLLLSLAGAAVLVAACVLVGIAWA